MMLLVQPATVDEHFQLLLDDRDVIDSEFKKVTPDDLPEWFDEYLFKKWVEMKNGKSFAQFILRMENFISVERYKHTNNHLQSWF